MWRQMVAVGSAMLALSGVACADGFIGLNAFSGFERLVDFTQTEMPGLGHPTAHIGEGILVTDGGGGTGEPAWRGNTDWSALFSNIPGASLGRALADSWGASDLLVDVTGADNPNRLGMLLSTGTQTTWTVRVYNPSFGLIDTGTVTMPGASQAIFVGYEASGGIGYLRVTDSENNYITIMDDVRFESTRRSSDVTVTGVNIRNDFGDYNATYDIGNTFDQSGMNLAYTSGATNFDAYTWMASAVLSGNDHDAWLGAIGAPLPGNIDFDLGAEWSVNRIAMWSYTTGDVNCLDGFDVFVDDNPAFSSPTFAGSFTFVNAGPRNPRRSQVFDVTDSVGRYVRLRLTTQNSSLVGMGEFVFGATSPGSALGLTVTGACPGQITVAWSGSQPNATVALLFARNTGSFVIPFGPCQGTVLGLGNQGIRLVNTFPSGLNGSGSRTGNAGSAACRGFLQMHDIPNCDLSNVAQLP